MLFSVLISSYIFFWTKVDFKYLKTRRVNRDSLENYFGNIREQSGNLVNLTPIQFERDFRKFFCHSFLQDNLGVLVDKNNIFVPLKAYSGNIYKKKYYFLMMFQVKKERM